MSTTERGFDGEPARLADLLKRAHLGGAWHGPALAELLSDVDAARAAARPVAGAHTIWEIVLHLSGWTDVVRRRVEGEPVAEPDEGDWPEVVVTTEAAWRTAVETLRERDAALRDAVARLDAARLHEPIAPEKGAPYQNILGQLQHLTYHTGQIAVLKKG